MARRKTRRQWGSGQVYQPKPGGPWAVRWYENGARRFKGNLPDRDTAERVLAKIRAEVASGNVGLPPDRAGFPTLAEEAKRWIERREHTHRAWKDDRCRWNTHLEPFFGRCRAHEVDAAGIRRFIEQKLSEGLNPATVGHCVRLLSTFFSDLCERPRETGATANPIRTLPRSTRRLVRPTHDPRNTPFLETLGAVRNVYAALEEPYSVAFAVGALAGLRTGEVLGLDWRDVNLESRRIVIRQQVQDSALGPLKDDETRTVPIQVSLLPILKAWHLKSGGTGILFRPDRPGRRAGKGGTLSTFMRPHTLHAKLRAALKAAKLPTDLTWYQCTRHTFASQWVLAGGSMEKLAAVMGHSSTEVTKRYAHLRPDHFREADYALLDVDLARSPGEVVSLSKRGAVGHEMDNGAGGTAATNAGF